VIDALGLAAYFADILAPDVTGYLKTSRPFFRDYLDDSQAINIMVGDNYIDDVVFPKSFDLYSFWIPRKPWANDLPMAEILQMNPLERPRLLDPEAYTVCPDAILVSLDELIPLVEQIEQQEPKTSL
jgi:FMN phosphatase YigB (HAD superfamily)